MIASNDPFALRPGEGIRIEPLDDHVYAVKILPTDMPGEGAEVCNTAVNYGLPVEQAAVIFAYRMGSGDPWAWLQVGPATKEWIATHVFDNEWERGKWLGMRLV